MGLKGGTIYDPLGREVSTVQSIDIAGAEASARAITETKELPAKVTIDLRPRRGFVLVDRPAISIYHDAEGEGGERLVKSSQEIENEKWHKRHFARIVSIGGPREELEQDDDLREGQRVIIEDSLFDEFELEPGLTVWLGPYSAVKAIFVEKTEIVLPCGWWFCGHPQTAHDEDRCRTCAEEERQTGISLEDHERGRTYMHAWKPKE